MCPRRPRSQLPTFFFTPFIQSQSTPPERSAALPVTRVSLYKNGVGFFEHTGQVTGNASVTIDFTSSQLNDVLQSLTAIDLNGGRISGAGYNSTTPLEQQLKTLPLSLDANPTVSDFYSAIRGARLEIRSGVSIVSGRLLSIEAGSTATPHAGQDNSDSTEQQLLLTVVSDAGEVHTVPVTPATSVRLLDSALDSDISRYLKLLDSTRSQGLRHLTLDDHGTGSRELHVSYISEVPVWKSTYRILFTESAKAGATQTATLQGWSVVDNTTGTDWVNVHLSLIAGAPQSFIQPLSQPIYSHRPEVPIAQEAQLTPQTFESGDLRGMSGSGIQGTVTDPTGAIIPNATVIVINSTNGTRHSATSNASGYFSVPLPAGDYRVQVSSLGFSTLSMTNVSVDGQHVASLPIKLSVGAANETVEVTGSAPMLNTSSAVISGRAMGVPNSYVALTPGVVPPPPPPPPSYEESATESFTNSTNTAAFDDFFAYNLSEPISIRKNESALVPILQSKVAADRVTLVHSNGIGISEPLRALWITNTSGLTLDRGSFTIVENGSFGGEGLLDPIHAGEKRLLSYAADQAIHVSTQDVLNNSKLVRVTVSNGILIMHQSERNEITYVIHNAAADARTVILEHPVQAGYTLDSSSKPEETTSSVYRFRINTAAGDTARLHVAVNHSGLTTYRLTSTNDGQLTMIFTQAGNNPSLASALAPILEARRQEAATDAAVDNTKTKLDNLHANEDRQRANITALHDSDKVARERFVNDLNHTEDEIIATQKELDARTAEHEKAEQELSRLIDSLNLDLPIG